MKQKDYEYIHGAAARKLEYDVYEENRVLKEKKQYKNNRKAKFNLVVSILAVLLVGLAVVYRFALITDMSYKIIQSEKDYYDLKNENSMIRLKVEQDTDLANIKLLAETKLSMQKPDKSQIVYINVEKKDHTVVINAKDEEAQTDANIFTAFISKVAGLFNLFN